MKLNRTLLATLSLAFTCCLQASTNGEASGTITGAGTGTFGVTVGLHAWADAYQDGGTSTSQAVSASAKFKVAFTDDSYSPGGAPTISGYITYARDDSSYTGATNHVWGGWASGGATTDLTSASAYIDLFDDWDSSIFSSTGSVTFSGQTMGGANRAWTFTKEFETASLSAQGELYHPTTNWKDDIGWGTSYVQIKNVSWSTTVITKS